MVVKKAAVVAPPVRDFYFTPGRSSALGAESVRFQLGLKGIVTVLFNFPRHNGRGKPLELPGRYEYLRPYLLEGEKGPLSFFSGRKLYGPSFSEAAEMILSCNPDVVFISLFAWTYGADALELARELRKAIASPIPLILGGAGAAVLPEYFRSSGLFDEILTGEAEIEIPRYLRAIDSSGGLTEKPAPVLSFNSDKKGKQWLTLSLSRGCPKLCLFCSNFLTQGRRFRTVDLAGLEKELKKLPVDHSKELNINLEDDNLLMRKEYFREFLTLARRLFPSCTFTADNGLDYTLLDEEFTSFLIESGFGEFSFSLGSADPEILRREKRPADLVKLESLLLYLKKRHIPATTFFIAGLPGDRTEGVVDTLLYLHRLATQTGISPFYPVPGLPRFEDKKVFLETHPSLCSGSSVYPWGESLTTAQLVTAFRLSRLSNFLRKENHLPDEMELIEKIRTSGKLHTWIGRNRKLTAIPHLDDSMTGRFLRGIGLTACVRELN